MGKKKGKKPEAESEAGPSTKASSETAHRHHQHEQSPRSEPPHKKAQHQKQPQHQPPLPQAAWPRGPPQQPIQPQPGWPGGPPQQPIQPQPGWPRGPPQQPPLPQAAWPRGPPQQPPQPQPGWPRGPPQQPTQPQPGWPRGPPQQPPQPQPGWPRGPPQQPTQPQPGWPRGPPQQQPPQPQPAWPRPPQQPQQQPAQPQPAWPRGPPQQSQFDRPQSQQQQSERTQQTPSQSHEKSSQETQQKDKTGRPKKSSDVPGGGIEFAPRICATRKQGKTITVSTNFYRLMISKPNTTVYHYNVVIEPDKPKFLIRMVWDKFVKLVYPGRLTAFDGNKNAYSKGPLSDSRGITTLTVINPESNKEKEFKVSIEEVRQISFSCFENFREKALQSRSMKILPEAEIAVLDVILNNWACENFVRCGSSFFPLSSALPTKVDLSEKLCLRFGYFQSAVLGYNLYLNFDISHKAFYKECPLLAIVESFQNSRTKEIDVDEMTHFLRNVKVEYQLPNDPNSTRIYRVNKLVDNANRQTFSKEDGSTMTVATYFAKEKNCALRRPELPLLWVGPTQKSIYIPMEFCRVVSDQVYRGLMDPYETREMVRKATSNARDRLAQTYQVFDKTRINAHPLMKEFGLEVSDRMEKVPARILDPPVLKTTRSVRVRDGSWRIQDFSEPVTLDKWCILVLDKRLNRQSVMNLQNVLMAKGKDFNMRISDPAKAPIESDVSLPALKKAFSQLRDMKMIFVVMSEQKGVYGRVKAICETQEGILTQCIKGRTVGQDVRKLSATVENILLKVNAKLGGKNHTLDQNSVPQCLKGKVMVIGADVTHPSPGMKIPSVAAVTVSCDPEAFQYTPTMRVQPKGEMIQDLQEIVSIHLRKFYEIRRSYPEKIIFFRDGVSEGELPKVFNGELAAVRNACSGLCQPKITFVVVQKRHHARFYPTRDADEQGKNYNVPVGTCVDSEIVHPRDLDFYLVSHNSILGTARPTRYRLLYDDNKLTDDEIETLSFYLCHLYSRCNRSVSYPSPTFNAHLAAARVRAYLEGLNLTGGKDIDDIKKYLTDNISSISPMFFV